MAYHVTVEDMNELFYRDYMGEGVQNTPPVREFSLPGLFAESSFKLMQSGGTAFSQSKISVLQDTYIDEAPEQELFFIGFALEGKAAGLQSLDNKRLSGRMQAGCVDFFFANGQERLRSWIGKNSAIRRISLFPSRQELIDYALSFNNHELANKLSLLKQSQLISQIRLPVTVLQTGNQLFHNPYRGAMHDLYRETLLSQLKLQIIEVLFTHAISPVRLSERDRAQIHQARSLLLQDLSDPPSVDELSRQIGLNKDKLSKGFKVVFNNTVYKTLTESRMQRAMQQLKADDMSITEIAHDAGYQDASAFIRAFRKYTKTTPKAYRTQRTSVLMPTAKSS